MIIKCKWITKGLSVDIRVICYLEVSVLNCLILPYLVLMVGHYELGHKLQRLALETNSIIGIMSLVRCSNFVIEVHQNWKRIEKLPEKD